MSFVRVSRRGPASWAVLDRPDRGNALGPEIATDLAGWIATEGFDPAVSCLVIGATGKAFCAGADVKASQAMVGRPAARKAFFDQVDSLLSSFADVPVPVIAAVDGAAYAGGLELVLACDLVLAGPGARLGDRHLQHGRIPAWGGAARLAGAVGPWGAAAALLLPRVFSGADLLESGLVSAVSAEGALEADVQALAAHFATLERGALSAMKRLVAAQREAALAPMLALGRKHFEDYLAGPEMAAPPAGFTP